MQDDDEVVHPDFYYASMLKSLKQNEEHLVDITGSRSPFPKSLQTGTPPIFDDPSSPYAFMQTMKFHMWHRSFQTKGDPTRQSQIKRASKGSREENRLLFLCSKEAENLHLLPKSGDKVKLLLSQMEIVPRTVLERKVEKELLNQYRKDPDNYQRLLRRVEASKESNKTISKSNAIKVGSTIAKKSLEERLVSARAKRETLVMQTNMLHQFQTQTKLERSEHLQKSIIAPADARVLNWLGMIQALCRLELFGNIVTQVRCMRTKDITSWKAAKLIQKVWRRFKNPTVKKANILETMKKNMAADQSHQSTFEIRCDSASLLCRFLKETRFRAIVGIFFRKIRKIQKEFRQFTLITEHRLQLLYKLIDNCVGPMSHHINAVLAGRGLDLKNLSFFEQTHLKNIHLNRPLAMLRAMYTESFHGVLRLNASKLVDFHRDFVATGKFWADNRYSELRRDVLKQFLANKRHLFLEEITKKHALDLTIPEITIDEVRKFIKCSCDPSDSGPSEFTSTSADPLQRYLEVIENKIAEHYVTRRFYQSPFRYKNDNGEMCYFQKENAYLMPRLLLLTGIEPHEVLTVLLQFLEHVKAAHNHGPDDGGKLKNIRMRLHANKGIDDADIGVNVASPFFPKGSLLRGNSQYNGGPSRNNSSSSFDMSPDGSGYPAVMNLNRPHSGKSSAMMKSRNGVDIPLENIFNGDERQVNASSRMERFYGSNENNYDSSSGFKAAVRPTLPQSSSSLTSPHRKIRSRSENK